MERESNKRGRMVNADEPPKKKIDYGDEYYWENDGFEATISSRRPLEVFEFPWQKENGGLVVEGMDEGWDLRHVFFCSLVDGCSATIGVPGDRLWPSPPPVIDASWIPEKETDCVWNCGLTQQIPPVPSKTANA